VLKIVVVDDEELSLQLTMKMLEKQDQAKIVGAFSKPLEALKYIPELKPDAVFLDIEMPGINGVELAKRLIEQDEDLHIVFVTAYNQYAIDAFKVSAVNYLLKPIDAEELSKTLLRILKYKKMVVDVQIQKTIRIKCFGEFAVFNPNGEKIKWTSKKAEELLSYFILNQGKQIDKWKIGDDLWPQANEEQLNSSFHTTLFMLRKTLEQEKLPITIESEKGSKDGYYCRIEQIECDLFQAEAFLAKELEVCEDTVAEFEGMVSQVEGKVYQEQAYLWSLAYQQKITNAMIHIFVDMSTFYIGQQEYSKALKVLNKGLQLEPHHEQIHIEIMRIYYYQNNKLALQKHYKAFKTLLKIELFRKYEEQMKY
jgi:two-component SAPR family response regulator